MITSLREQLQSLLGVSGLSWASFLTQVFIIVFFMWFGYKKLIKDSPVEKAVKGISF